MQFQRTGTTFDHFNQSIRLTGVAFARKGKVHGKGICGLQHTPNMPWPWCTGCCQSAMRWASSPAQHCSQARVQRIFDLLWADKVDMAVKTTRGEDAAFTSNNFGSWAYDNIHTRLCVGIASLANLVNASVVQTHICFIDTFVINNQRVSNYRVHSTRCSGRLGLTHTVTDNFATPKFYFFPVGYANATICTFSR
jgi:hypothetical protein